MKSFKFFISLFISTLSLFNVSSQESDFEKSIQWEEKQVSNNTGYYNDIDILKKDDNFIYYFSFNVLGDDYTYYKRKYYYLVRHDIKSNENSIIQLECNAKDDRYILLYKYYENNKFHLIKSFKNKNENKIYIFHETYDFKTFKFNDDIKQISEFDYSSLKNSDDLKVNALQSNSNIVISYVISNKSTNSLKLDIFNLDGTYEWSSSEQFNFEKNGSFELLQTLTDSNGSLYILQKNHHEKLFPYNSDLYLSLYEKDKPKKSIQLNIEMNNYINKANLYIKNDDVYCVGLFSKKGNLSALGIVSAHLDKSLNLLGEISKKEFSLDLISEGINKKDKDILQFRFLKGYDFEFEIEYDNPKFVSHLDGSFDYAIEKHIKYFDNYNAQKGNFGSTHSYYKGIYVSHCSADGEIQWMNKIPKDEILNNFYELSGSYFMYINNKDKLNVIINEIDNNHLVSSNKNTTKTLLYDFDKSGNRTISNLINDRLTASELMVSKTKSINNTLFFVRYSMLSNDMALSLKNNCIQFGKLSND